jgi:FimV-like protein
LLTAAVLWSADESKKVAKTRMLLKTKVTFTWKDTQFGGEGIGVIHEIEEAVPGLKFHLDNKGGVNNNKPITYSCKDKPLEDVLDEILGKYGWGYYVKTVKAADEGHITIHVGEERGYPKGEEPKEKAKAEDKGKGEDKPKGDDKPKDKPKAEDKPKDKPKAEDKPKVEDDPDKLEKDAARKLKLAKNLIEDGKIEGAREYLNEIKDKYKDTKAAAEAKELLDKLDKSDK